ncbi:PAQR family membrane homeostasis protein TrhA [Maribacter aestuarii]|uniref:PAQR family membrane homeostasis protein TrhA n=1 Tax=Maribacter aestuarii TaxID=1130723 RepID=UPI00322146A5
MFRNTSISKEESLNALSHGMGALLSVLGLILLLLHNTNQTEYALFSILLYGTTLISMFLVSALYHAISRVTTKRILRILDHINIYFLIAGTYTPVALITLEEGNGWTILVLVWSIAALGTLLKLFFTGKYEFFSLLLYLVMGWLIIFDFELLLKNTTELGVLLLFLGGGFYTLGIIF